MGKRKLNGTSFWQCEWTGFPMKSAHCYWPCTSATGKLVKKGSYCNWESVMAHAKLLLEKHEIEPDEHGRVVTHVENITGTIVEPAPHYEELAHTKGRMNALDFHNACVYQSHPISAVKISPCGDVFEVLVHPEKSDSGRFFFADYLHKPYTYHGPPSTFHSMRKKGKSGPDRDLSVWYFAAKELPHNPVASNLFKMQLYGDVLLIQQSREQSFMPRERFVSFNKAQFDEQFCKKRKRTEVQCLTGTQYEEIKAKMQQSLNAYEKDASALAAPPKDTSRMAAPAALNGKSLAQKVKARGPTPGGSLPPPPALLRAS